MEVFVLGSGVGIPNLKRAYPGLFIKAGLERILMDPGPFSVRRLLEFGFDYTDVSSVILTHFHPDHCLDFVSFLFACKYPLKPRRKDITVIGPPGLKNFYRGILNVFGNAITPEIFEVRLQEVSETSIAAEKAELSVKLVAHSDNSIGIRYKDAAGKILCYSGDTGYCDNIIKLADNADLLILECSFPDKWKVNGHLTPFYAGRIAGASKAKKLLLTHLYPVCDTYDILAQCKKEFKGDIRLARDSMRIKV
ncbi:MAG: MBL fold metallo-hydrolase [Candidatus Omnitrophota bacterium]|nr:MBL fold metallo-hydrolase [Candidatus Omnitrophota bacterium]